MRENLLFGYTRVGAEFFHLRPNIREDADLTQAQAGEILGISRQHYALYEKGDRELPMHHFIRLARFYNVSLDDLAGLTDEPKRLS